MSFENSIVDESGKSFILERKLGEGGQGTVYLVKGGRYAVKILNATVGKEDRLKNQISFVKRLPLEKLPIAKPVTILREPLTGYIMEFASGMVPFASLISVPKDEPVGEWYLKTGGLKRRLKIIKNISNALRKIHAQSLAFADISHNNIFISEDPEYSEIFFIDCDNLRESSLRSDSVLYTPGYAAPEILKGKSGVNTLTDAYSFAVLAFQLLALIHPLTGGDYVTDSEPETEERALLGEIPWVEDDDDMNRSSSGIPRHIVLSPDMKNLFHKTFGKGLIQDPYKRPSAVQWFEKLEKALDFIIECSECRSTYFYNEKECPFCGHRRPELVQVQIWRFEPDEFRENLKKVRMVNCNESFILQENVKLAITTRLTVPEPEGSESVCSLEYQRDKIVLYPNQSEVYVSRISKIGSEQIKRRVSIPIYDSSKESEEYVFHFRNHTKSQRIFRFRRIK